MLELCCVAGAMFQRLKAETATRVTSARGRVREMKSGLSLDESCECTTDTLWFVWNSGAN